MLSRGIIRIDNLDKFDIVFAIFLYIYIKKWYNYTINFIIMINQNTPSDENRVPENRDGQLEDMKDASSPEVERDETINKGEDVNISHEVTERVEKTLEDPGQQLIALLDLLETAGVGVDNDTLEELKSRADILSVAESGDDTDPIRFKSAILMLKREAEDIVAASQDVEQAVKDAAEDEDEEVRELATKVDSILAILQSDQPGNDAKLKDAISKIGKDIEKINKKVHKSTLVEKLKTKVLPRIALYITLIVALLLGYQLWKTKNLLEDTKVHAGGILGKNWEPDQNWNDMIARAHEWQEKYEKMNGRWTIDSANWEQERQQFLRDATTRQGSLTALALDVERLEQELQRQEGETRRLRENNQANVELVRNSRSKMAKLRAEQLNSSILAWLAWGEASENPDTGNQFGIGMRNSLANSINDAIRAIAEEINAERNASEGDYRPWNDNRESLGKIKTQLRGLRGGIDRRQGTPDDFPFTYTDDLETVLGY